jgi:hypothetical protein
VSEGTLLGAIKALQPNIVHFFCHGTSEAAQARLELARPSDYDAEVPHGSIRLAATDLDVLGTTSSVWLVVLNCCQGAMSSGRFRSLAGDLVGGGTPAVIAMRDSVDATKANQFAGVLYKHLLDALFPMLPTEADAAAGNEILLSEDTWLNVMHPPREALSRPDPNSIPWWTLPVVYVRRGPLKLKAQPRSVTLLGLLPEQARLDIVKLRIKADELSRLRISMEGSPRAVEEVDRLIREASLQADESEQTVVEAFLAAPRSDLERELAEQRVAELKIRLGR